MHGNKRMVQQQQQRNAQKEIALVSVCVCVRVWESVDSNFLK